MPDEVGSFQAGDAAKRINLRHLHWLKRHTTTSKKNMGWRPRKRYRISTRHWILAKDNMLKVCTRFNGLQAFARGSQADDAWSRASWKTWPHLNLAQDQGPDGFSAVMALKYKPELKCNITEWWDESHGCASVGRDWGDQDLGRGVRSNGWKLAFGLSQAALVIASGSQGAIPSCFLRTSSCRPQGR